MVRHANTEMTVRKEGVYTHSSLETGGTMPGRATRGSIRVGQEAEGRRGESTAPRLSWGVRGRQGREQSTLALGRCESLRWALDYRAVPCCLVSGPGVI